MKKKVKKDNLTNITGSFSFKVSLKNHLTFQELKALQEKLMGVDYEVQDFFLSASAQCKESLREKKAEELHNFCKKVVIKSVNSYIAQIKNVVKGSDKNKNEDVALDEAQQDAGIE